MHIRKDDTVEVITGQDCGKRGVVIAVNNDKGRVTVEGVNRIWKHVPRSQRNPQGGRLLKEAAIDASNVMVVCPACNAASRMAKRIEDDGSKVRVCRKCNAVAGQISPAK